MGGVGKEIDRRYDEYGPVQVFDNGNKRTLMFGANDEQGCVLKESPHIAQFDYIRAMMLVLLFKPQNERCLLLGLGSGALATALSFADKSMHLDVVELRQTVIDMAYRHFYLPQDERIRVIHADAGAFLHTETQQYDVLFSDLYHAQGMDVQQGSSRFLTRCAARLHADGWLVLNYWQNHRRLDVVSQLKNQFRQVWSVSVGKDNWILLASNSSVALDKSQKKAQLKALNVRLGFSLSKVSRHLAALV